MAIGDRESARPRGESAPDFSVFGRTPRFGLLEEQRVLDAVAALQAQRTRIASALVRGRSPGAVLLGIGIVDINHRLFEESQRWQSLLSTRPRGRVEELRVSMPINRRIVVDGMRMVSVFDLDSTTPEARLLLSGERAMRYHFALAPLQMKLVDGRQVLLAGPVIGGEPTVMAVDKPACLAAAMAYWKAVLATAFPAVELRTPVPDATDRQRQVIALLSTGVHDGQIASALGISVRTVRTEVAVLMDRFGVGSRFALGRVVQEQLRGGSGAVPERA